MEWEHPWSLGWQSRVGPVKWLSPSTPDVMQQLASEGVERIVTEGLRLLDFSEMSQVGGQAYL